MESHINPNKEEIDQPSSPVTKKIKSIPLNNIPLQIDLKDQADDGFFLPEADRKKAIKYFEKNPEAFEYVRGKFTVRNYGNALISIYKGDEEHRLGKGGIGKVKIGQVIHKLEPKANKAEEEKPTASVELGEFVAIKNIFFNEKQTQATYESQIENEVEALRNSNEYIGGIHFTNGKKNNQEKLLKSTIAIKLAKGLSLHQFLQRTHAVYDSIPEERILTIIKNMILAVKELHEKNRVHCDIKLHNMQLDPETDQVKLVDKQPSRICLPNNSIDIANRTGMTFAYCAQEVLSKRQFSMASDIYSLGLAIAEFLKWTGFDKPLTLKDVPGSEFNPVIVKHFSGSRFTQGPMLNRLIQGLVSVQPHFRPKLDGVVDMINSCIHSVKNGNTIKIFKLIPQEILPTSKNDSRKKITVIDYQLLKQPDLALLKFLTACDEVKIEIPTDDHKLLKTYNKRAKELLNLGIKVSGFSVAPANVNNVEKVKAHRNDAQTKEDINFTYLSAELSNAENVALHNNQISTSISCELASQSEVRLVVQKLKNELTRMTAIQENVPADERSKKDAYETKMTNIRATLKIIQDEFKENKLTKINLLFLLGKTQDEMTHITEWKQKLASKFKNITFFKSTGAKNIQDIMETINDPNFGSKF